MNKIEINIEGINDEPEWIKGIKPFAQTVLKKLEKNNWDLSLFFCTNKIIKRINKQYRNLNKPTDVLSFIMGETEGKRYLPGDVVISLEMIEENARYFGVFPGEELRRSLIHGILHLTGMDHSSSDKKEPMLVLQEKLLGEIQGGE